MKIVSKIAPQTVTPAEMKDGEIGIIRNWSVSGYIGRIVQKYKNDLITLGMRAEHSFLGTGDIAGKKCQVEILSPGTQLEI